MCLHIKYSVWVLTMSLYALFLLSGPLLVISKSNKNINDNSRLKERKHFFPHSDAINNFQIILKA